MQHSTSNRNEFSFDIGCVASIFDTLNFIARLSAQWANWRSIERKKKSRKSIVHHEFMPSSYAPLILFDLMCAGVIYHNSGIVLRQFKALNEHKFDCLFALLMQFWWERCTFRQVYQKIFLLGVTFRQVVSNIKYACSAGSLSAKKLKGALIFIEWFE